MGKHYYLDERSKEWKNKVDEKDPLCSAKKDTIDTAVDLFYKDSVLEKILNAKTERELDRIMSGARCA